ncbi:MAG TPA: gamma-butyrobetaine hydroxylase-like domain-containing protein [Candidatus Binatia bacterium]|jgi:DUF971 family protein
MTDHSQKRPPTPAMKTLTEVGRYALGIGWGDGHESILPYRHLRAHCPCDACRAAAEDRTAGAPAGPASAPGAAPPRERLDAFDRLGDTTLVLRWADGHESLFVDEELRALCRCAYCAGEPEYPITGGR